MKPVIFHLRDGGRKWWVVATADDATRGQFGETLRQVLARHEQKHGKPDGGYVRIAGYCRVSEAVCSLAHLRGAL